MKVAIFNLNTYPEMSGGSERSCIELAEELVKRGVDIDVLTLQKFTSGFSKLKYKNVKILKIPLINIYWPTENKKRSILKKAIWNIIDIFNLPMALLISLFVKFKGYNIVHTNNIKGASPAIFLFLKALNVKIVHTTRDYYLLDRKAWTEDINELTSNKSKKESLLHIKIALSKLVDCVVYNSHYMKTSHESYGAFAKVKSIVIYNGFKKIEDKYLLGKKSEFKTFGYIGRVSKEKGIDILIREFLKFKNGKFELLIAGCKKSDFLRLYPYLEKELNERDDINFLGYKDNVDFYRLVDCVIVPSSYNEPFGRVAMEAIFSGLPVIVSNRGGLPEQVKNDAVGLVCSNNNYYSAMNQIAEKKVEETFDLNNYTRPFSIEKCASDYLEIYKGILE